MSGCLERRLRNGTSVADPACVYTWGCGQHGQLGHGDKLDRPGPALVAKLLPTECSMSAEPVSISASGSRTAVVDSEGRVYVFGGATETEPGNVRPVQVTELMDRKIKEVACGALHMAALDARSGEVLQWGNVCGTLISPSLVPGLESIVVDQVVACGAFTLAIAAGSVYSWGCNSRGQLGMGDTQDRKSASRITALSSSVIIKAACGGQHSLFLTSDGSVFACGFNKYGQLGLGDVMDRTLPQPISRRSLPPIQLIACGDNHSMFATQIENNSNLLYVCGRRGQCGFETDNVLIPQPLDDFNSFLQATADSMISICGNGAFNASHSAVVTRLGRLYTWGGSKYNQCGVWGKDNVPTPTLVESLATLQVSQVACGWLHTVALSKATKTVKPHIIHTLLGPFTPIPGAVMSEILMYLTPKDLASLSLVNSVMHQLANADELWANLFKLRHYTVTPAYMTWETSILSDKNSVAYKYAIKLQPSTAVDIVALWKIRFIYACNKKFLSAGSLSNVVAAAPAPAQKRGWFSSLFTKPHQFRILMVGLDAAGRTSILYTFSPCVPHINLMPPRYRLVLNEVISAIPTIGTYPTFLCVDITKGFNVESFNLDDFQFTVWDIGGEDKIRPLWRHYFLNTQALAFVIDSNDRERLEEASVEFHKALAEDELTGAVVIVFANKQDLPNAMTVEEISAGMKMSTIRNRTWNVRGCSVITGEGLREGFLWLGEHIS
ncbi:ADPribosylation factor subfamily protein [Pelomyxa schiedti]|nr:ADPribosylation factor subfamily protein [Pelomyxa schiedti]